MSQLAVFFRWVVGSLAIGVASTGAVANPVLASDGLTAGFGLSQFADGFPSTGFCCGPIGIAFLDGGKVMVSDYPGNVRIFATDADGQHAGSFPVLDSLGQGNAVGLARLGNFIYLTQQTLGRVVKLTQAGIMVGLVTDGIPSATAIVANPVNGKLYVSDCCSGSGIWIVDPATGAKIQFKTGNFDGMSVSSDGATLYAELGGSIIGYRLSDGAVVFNSGFISGADGTELGAGTLAGEIFVNTNNGELWEVSLTNPADKHLIVNGGTRGDFVTADPNGTLLFTQTTDIWRLTAPAGGCIGANCNSAPEPGGLALAGLAAIRRRRH